jgi:hypothetical protein
MFHQMMNGPFARGLPTRQILQSVNYSPLLKKVVVAGGPCGWASFEEFEIGQVEKLVENGWLHTATCNEEIEYFFASPLHMW